MTHLPPKAAVIKEDLDKWEQYMKDAGDKPHVPDKAPVIHPNEARYDALAHEIDPAAVPTPAVKISNSTTKIAGNGSKHLEAPLSKGDGEFSLKVNFVEKPSEAKPASNQIFADRKFIPEIIALFSKPEVQKFLVSSITIECLRDKGLLSTEDHLNKKYFAKKGRTPDHKPSIASEKTAGGPNQQEEAASPLNDTSSQPHSQQPSDTKQKAKNPGLLLVGHINDYVPICLYLSKILLLDDEVNDFAHLYKAFDPANKHFDHNNFYSDRLFLKCLLNQIIILEELYIFDYFLEHIPDMVQLVDLLYFDRFSENNRYDLQYKFFEHLHSYLVKSPVKRSLSLKSLNTTPLKLNKIMPEINIHGNISELMTRDKVVILVKNYFECTQENVLLMKILRLLEIDDSAILNILLDTREEDRLIRLVREIGFVELLDMRDLVRRGLYKTLILFDKNELINVFNLPVKEENPDYNVYSELCKRIKKGIDVEGLCNVIIYVSETFWDMEKLFKFYEALSMLLRSTPKDQTDPTDQTNSTDQKEQKDKNQPKEPSWLVYLRNPPLFFITLIYFFNQAKKQLDYKDPQIIELNKDMLNFCISYIQNASDENLKMNLFDKDGKEMEFLNYVMLIEEMKILEIDTIENLLNEMWDINRDSMQTISTFMRIDSMRQTFNRFSLNVFTKDYETPIEKDDSFQMEFRYTVNSVFMKVSSEIFWPCLMIIMDFIFSMRILQTYQSRNNLASKTWLMDYFNESPFFSILHIVLRVSQMISFFFKAMAIRSFNRGGYTLLGFYKLLLFLYFVQMAVWPILFIKYFNFFSIVQMILTVVQVFYVLYKTLSLDEVGVTIRIFGRMALVVLIFGTLSFSIITVIGFAIHISYTNFTQKIEGQIYPDLNLFSDLYQGIMTLYEFVFGAVVLVRPYLEENMYTYTMSFVMTLFSFFGNIMLANMLVAFLTSQFEFISTNAKYLTMNMQYELIQIYNMKDMDAVFTVPFILAIPALPFYFSMWKQGESRRKANLFLRKVTHITSFFIPTFVLMMIKLFLLLIWRYIEITIHLILGIPVYPTYIMHLFLWILGGPFLLLKLYFQDLYTICIIMLNFKKSGQDLLNFDLEDEARANLVKIFNKMKRVMNQHLANKRDTIEAREFLKGMGVIEFADTLAINVADGKGDDLIGGFATIFEKTLGVKQEKTPNELTPAVTTETNPFNQKYSQSEKLIGPLLVMKFADENKETNSLILDLRFMQKKFMNNVNTENVHRLLSFDKNALTKSSIHISVNEDEIELRQNVSGLSKVATSSHKKMEFVRKEIASLRVLANSRN